MFFGGPAGTLLGTQLGEAIGRAAGPAAVKGFEASGADILMADFLKKNKPGDAGGLKAQEKEDFTFRHKNDAIVAQMKKDLFERNKAIFEAQAEANFKLYTDISRANKAVFDQLDRIALKELEKSEAAQTRNLEDRISKLKEIADVKPVDFGHLTAQTVLAGSQEAQKMIAESQTRAMGKPQQDAAEQAAKVAKDRIKELEAEVEEVKSRAALRAEALEEKQLKILERQLDELKLFNRKPGQEINLIPSG